MNQYNNPNNTPINHSSNPYMNIYNQTHTQAQHVVNNNPSQPANNYWNSNNTPPLYNNSQYYPQQPNNSIAYTQNTSQIPSNQSSSQAQQYVTTQVGQNSTTKNILPQMLTQQTSYNPPLPSQYTFAATLQQSSLQSPYQQPPPPIQSSLQPPLQPPPLRLNAKKKRNNRKNNRRCYSDSDSDSENDSDSDSGGDSKIEDLICSICCVSGDVVKCINLICEHAVCECCLVENYDNNKYICNFCKKEYNIEILKELCNKNTYKILLEKNYKPTNKPTNTVTINNDSNSSLKCYKCEQNLSQLKQIDNRNSFKLKCCHYYCENCLMDNLTHEFQEKQIFQCQCGKEIDIETLKNHINPNNYAILIGIST